jgi:hypothetical protein
MSNLRGGSIVGGYKATHLGNLLNHLKTVLSAGNGTGSGVDVDTVDGKHASDFQVAGSYAAATHTHTKSQITDFPASLPANGGSATTATKLAAARTISLIGDILGSFSFDGSTNVSFDTQIGVYSATGSSVDANGIYTIVDFKRSDGTLFLKSTLQNGTSPNYTTQILNYYNAAGTTISKTITITYTYDSNGNISSRAVS